MSYNAGENFNQKSSLCCTMSCCMRVLFLPNMSDMCVENSFSCVRCLIGKQHFSMEKEICNILSKILLCKSKGSGCLAHDLSSTVFFLQSFAPESFRPPVVLLSSHFALRNSLPDISPPGHFVLRHFQFLR